MNLCDTKKQLWDNLNKAVQQFLAVGDCNISEIADFQVVPMPLVVVLDKIFIQGIRPEHLPRQTVMFPGFCVILEWCLGVVGRMKNELEEIKELKHTLFACDESTFNSHVPKVLHVLLGDEIMALILILVGDRIRMHSNYTDDAFVTDKVCHLNLLTSLNALLKKSAEALSEIPLLAHKQGFSAILRANQLFSDVSEGCCASMSLPQCLMQDEAHLPDIVACSNVGGKDPKCDNKHGVVSISSAYRDDAVAIKHSCLKGESEELIQFDQNFNAKRCLKEDSPLHLDELLIMLIQGKVSGLPCTDIQQCTDKSVLNTPVLISDHHVNFDHQRLSMGSCKTYWSHPLCDDTHSPSDSITCLPDLQWCVLQDDFPQYILPLPQSLNHECYEQSGKNISVFDDMMYLMSVSCPSLTAGATIASQKYKCFSCGMCLSDSCSGFKYCELLRSYFCFRCHTNQSKRVIPAHILFNFDFKKYKVCDIACVWLDNFQYEPLFNIDVINPEIYKKSDQLRLCKSLRQKGKAMLKKVEFCSSPCIRKKLRDLPSHILRSDSSVYSVTDLIKVNKGVLCKQLKDFIVECSNHMRM